MLTQQRPVLPGIASGCHRRPVPTCPMSSRAGPRLRAPGPATQVGEKPVSRTVCPQNRARKTGLFGGIDGARQSRSASVQRNRPKFGGPRRGRHMGKQRFPWRARPPMGRPDTQDAPCKTAAGVRPVDHHPKGHKRGRCGPTSPWVATPVACAPYPATRPSCGFNGVFIPETVVLTGTSPYRYFFLSWYFPGTVSLGPPVWVGCEAPQPFLRRFSRVFTGF